MISFIVAIIVILLGNFIFILFLCIAKIIAFCKKKYFKLFYDKSPKFDTHSTFIFITLNEWIFIST